MRTMLVAQGWKLLLGALFVVAALIVPASTRVQGQDEPEPAVHLPALPTGTWTVRANGFRTELNIRGVAANGDLLNSTFGGNPIHGLWDGASQRLQFLRVVNTAQPSTYQTYEGFLFSIPRTPTQGQPVTYYLTGSFYAFQGTGGTSPRGEYGWYATKTQTCC
jgi:hypothetical protein